MMKTELGIFRNLVIVLGCVVSAGAGQIPVANHSFEFPAIDPIENPLYAIAIVSLWREIDSDPYSQGTGTFRNTPADSNDHIVNADGSQLALLNSNPGNALEQEFPATYRVGKRYRLTVGVCPSMRYPPSPENSLALAFRYLYYSAIPTDIVTSPVSSTEMIANELVDFSVLLPTVQPTDPWADKNICIAIRTYGGTAGKYWDLDNVRLVELPPASPDISGDGFVNLNDFAQLAAQWQSCTHATADLTGDGCVNLDDVLIVAEFWLDTW